MKKIDAKEPFLKKDLKPVLKKNLAVILSVCVICTVFTACAFFPNGDRIVSAFDHLFSDLAGAYESITEASGSVSSSAAEEYTGDALTPAQLGAKYGFSFEDPDGLLTGQRGMEYCKTIDKALGAISKPVIKGFLKDLSQRGSRFSIAFVDENSENLGETNYTGSRIRIKIFAPRITEDDSVTNGITVETIDHEFAHALHDELEHKFGAENLKAIWCEFNRGYEYGGNWDEGCLQVFCYEYGMTDYYEDVATVFEDLAAYPAVMESRLSSKNGDPLYMKAKLWYAMMSSCYDLSESSLFDPYLNARSARGDSKDFVENYYDYLKLYASEDYRYGRYFDWDNWSFES